MHTDLASGRLARCNNAFFASPDLSGPDRDDGERTRMVDDRL